jgi:hypothetical protein
LVAPDLPRVDANTMYWPSGDHAGSKLWTWMPFESAAAGVICEQMPLVMFTVHTDSGAPAFGRAANATVTPSLETSGAWMSPFWIDAQLASASSEVPAPVVVRF